MEQQRRRRPGQHLVRVVIEGDDRGPGVTRAASLTRCSKEVGVPEVQAIEDADDGEDRAVRRAQPSDARDDLHQAVAAAVAGADTSTLSGARRPGPAAWAIATSSPPGPCRR